jgi:hypothetical protein
MVEGDGRTIAFLDRDTLAIGGSRDLRVLDVSERAVNAYRAQRLFHFNSGHYRTISFLCSRWRVQGRRRIRST